MIWKTGLAGIFREDSTLSDEDKGDVKLLYRNLRAACESGWDFSSRWFADGKNFKTIDTINIIPSI
jgi:alpha,alpha-trehalase